MKTRLYDFIYRNPALLIVLATLALVATQAIGLVK
jgi:hypothetical protein